MKFYRWKLPKNDKLKSERGVCFEDVVFHIEMGHLLDIIDNPNQAKYGGQKVYIIEMNKYVYMVPVVEDDEGYELITIIPTRKLTRIYLGGPNG